MTFFLGQPFGNIVIIGSERRSNIAERKGKFPSQTCELGKVTEFFFVDLTTTDKDIPIEKPPITDRLDSNILSSVYARNGASIDIIVMYYDVVKT